MLGNTLVWEHLLAVNPNCPTLAYTMAKSEPVQAKWA